MKKEAARRAELRKLPRPVFDGFADSQRTHQSVWGDPAMAVKICTDREPCCALVTLYAKMGLHRYNLLHRTNLEFVKVEKYNYFIPMLTTVYYITFVASDPATSLTQIFQTRVGEADRSMFALSCSIARRLGDDEKPSDTPSFFRPNLPEWPLENDPFDQFYVPDESEVQCIDWVRLYLELAVVISDRSQSHDLTSLEIVKVAIDASTSMEEEGLNYAKNATVYIRYKDYCEARVGKDVDRIAIVRRSYDDVLGLFHLEGQSSPGSESLFIEYYDAGK
ncbi:hypothetical protein AALP_AA6G028700 [Arabis alpina]|uniref:Uncharacterized protein n=1 Tax=Arabis alpina TaxID=50452 RepID=A0A087GLQ8_ARAAL|nr:hypothetical protein AALP_AA6G028700 [Arabis alpina]